MQSRMNKYYENLDDIEQVVPTRTKKNKDLYKEVSNLEIEDFDLNSNVSIIGDNSDNINIDDIKEILTEKYSEGKKKKSFGDSTDINLPEINLDETREYDINSILDKAKEEKEINYEKDRLKKLRDTQYDIFKDIEDYDKNDEEKTEKKKGQKVVKKQEDEQELLELINTITSKELSNEITKEASAMDDLDPLDILTDLRGDDENTKVMGALADSKEDTLEVILNDIDVSKDEEDATQKKDLFDEFEDNAYDHEEIDEDDIIDVGENINKREDDKEVTNKTVSYFKTEELGEVMSTKTLEIDKKKPTDVDNSFVSNTTKFNTSDFDFNDLRDDMKATKVIIKILIVIIVIVFIIACVILLNKFLGLGLF